MRVPSKTFLSTIGAITAAAAAARFMLRSSRRMHLQDKVVFITGGSRGLGLVLAREFANRGARVAICARSEKELERVRDEFTEAGRPLWTGACDVGVRAEIQRAIRTAQDELGPIDVLVNNA